MKAIKFYLLLILYFNFFSNVKTTDGINIGPSDTGTETITSETTYQILIKHQRVQILIQI